MSMLEDFDLNSMQQYTGSHKDIFRQTILDQETVFKKQVHELHRLYILQKNLMKDHPPLQIGKYHLWKAYAQSLPHETRLPRISNPSLGNCQNFQQRPSDLQLLHDQYFSLGDKNLSNKRKAGDHLKETMDVNAHRGGDFPDPLELRLSPSLGVAKGIKDDKRRSWCDRKGNICYGIVIDLEESTEEASDEDAKDPPSDFAAKVSFSGGKHDFPVTIASDPITSNNMKKARSNEIAESSSFVGDSKCFQGWSNDQGKCHGDVPHEQNFVSYGVRHFDLNEVQPDDSSCQPNDAIVAHPSTTSSSGGFSGLVSRTQETSYPYAFWRKEIKEFSDDSSEILERDSDVKLAFMNSNNKDELTESLIGPAPVSRPQINLSEDLGSHTGNTEKGRDELMLKPENGPNPTCVITTGVDSEKIVERDTILLCSDKIQSTYEDEHANESPASGKSSCLSVFDSSTVKAMQADIQPLNITLPASDQFSGTHGRSQVAETLSGEQDQRSSDSNEIKHECYRNREESGAVDDLIQIAAESLILISSENLACFRKHSTQTGSNESENEDKEQPHCSFDSFELMTLKLKDSSADDYSVTSKPFEVSHAERKDFSVKLRRGRRMKDFQKDILPSLSSLSRHEIREDINILEGVLRSREYRKMRGKTANAEIWCTPVRSKRSRLNYVGRKNF